MLLIKYIARLAKNNPKFKDFCGGIFSGTITVKGLVLVEALLSAFPADLSAWITLSGNSTSRSIPFDDALLAGISILKLSVDLRLTQWRTLTGVLRFLIMQSVQHPTLCCRRCSVQGLTRFILLNSTTIKHG